MTEESSYLPGAVPIRIFDMNATNNYPESCRRLQRFLESPRLF